MTMIRKATITAIVCLMAYVFTACQNDAGSPTHVAEQCAEALISGDYEKAFEYVYFGDEEKDQKGKEFALAIIQEMAKQGMPDDIQMKSFEVTDEEIDEKAGKATVTATVTYVSGKVRTEEIPLVKDKEGNWMLSDLW